MAMHLYEVDETLAPLKRAMPSHFRPLCIRHWCEMRDPCFVCSGRLTVNVPSFSLSHWPTLVTKSIVFWTE